MLERPNIFSYHDYRVFMNDWMAFIKKSPEKISLRKLCKESGISPALLSLVLSQKRTLTDKAAKKLTHHLGLNESERAYFENLVKLSEAGSQDGRVKAYQNLRRFEAYKEGHGKELEVFDYLSNWYYVAIRELALHPDFSDDVDWIQSQLVSHVPPSEIRRALNFLLEKGFLQKDSKGKFQQPNRNVECLSGVFQLSLNQFHKQILQLSTKAIDDVEKESRHLTGYSFMVSEDAYPEVVRILEEAKVKLQELELREQKKSPQDSKNQKVYHAELIAIPLTGGRK